LIACPSFNGGLNWENGKVWALPPEGFVSGVEKMEHFNAITSWGIDAKGEVSHVYA
jgi:hypothetical protein